MGDWSVSRLLVTAGRLVEQELAQSLRPLNLTPAGLGVLQQLEDEPRAQRDLARSARVEEQTISQVVDRLERLGMVERRPDPNDRRRHLVTLTRRGRSVLRKCADLDTETELTGLPQADRLRAGLLEVLRRLG